jgi:hypothetical protein
MALPHFTNFNIYRLFLNINDNIELIDNEIIKISISKMYNQYYELSIKNNFLFDRYVKLYKITKDKKLEIYKYINDNKVSFNNLFNYELVYKNI